MGVLITGIKFGADRALVWQSQNRDVDTHNLGPSDLLFGYDEDRALLDDMFLRNNAVFVESVAARAGEMYTNIFCRAERVTQTHRIEQRREDFFKITMDHLCQEIMLSQRWQWTILIPVNAALVLEFIARRYQVEVFALSKT